MASTIEVLQEIQKVDLEISKVEKEGSRCREVCNNKGFR